MGPRDIIKYISYRIVETANDRSGQIIIASPIALAVLILGLFDESRPHEIVSAIQKILIVCVGMCQLFIIKLDYIMALKAEDRARIFRTISFFSFLTMIFTSFGFISIYSTYYGIAIRVVLAIFVIGSLLTKTDTLYMDEDKKDHNKDLNKDTVE